MRPANLVLFMGATLLFGTPSSLLWASVSATWTNCSLVFFFRRCAPRDHPSVANLGVPSVGPVIAVSLICSSSQKSDTRARGNGTSGTRFSDNCQLATAMRARLCVLFLFCETMTGRQAGESYKLHEVKSYQLLQDRDELWGALR